MSAGEYGFGDKGLSIAANDGLATCVRMRRYSSDGRWSGLGDGVKD
jgi:hypothetical protein